MRAGCHVHARVDMFSAIHTPLFHHENKGLFYVFSFDILSDTNTLNAHAGCHVHACVDMSRALENVRKIVAWKRHDSSLMSDLADARPIRSIGIIGAGVMGAEIAAAYIKHNLPVTIFDNNPSALATIADRIAIELAAGNDNAADRAPVERLLHKASELSKAVRCDLIIESIHETLPAKREFFSRLQKHLAPDAILASNTSTIPIGKLAEGVSSPERFCGMHFFHPVRERPIVEIVCGPKTSEKTVAALAAHAKTIDKLPIVVVDGPGFLVNRLLLPYLTEALELLMEGVSIEMIENAAVEFGMAKGPFSLMDEIGLDTTLKAGWNMAAAFPERIPVSPLLVAMIKSGRLGQKSGAGFFLYPNPAAIVGAGFISHADPPSTAKSAKPDPVTTEIIARWAKTLVHRSTEDVILRLILPMILEAARIIEEDKVCDARDIDLGAIFGLGFPARRGGLLWWADTIKPSALLKMFQPLESIGPRLHPNRLLLELAADGDRFYSKFTKSAQTPRPIAPVIFQPGETLITPTIVNPHF